MSEASETTGWDELQQAAAVAAADTPSQSAWWQEYIDQAKTWWQKAALWQRGAAALMALAVVAVLGAGAVGAVTVAARALFPQEPVAAAAPTVAPTSTPTATPLPTPTVTPTPLPRLVVWSPTGNCAYVRPDPGVDNDPLACIPNGTQIVDLGERKQTNGLNWAKAQYPTKDGYVASGWMAYGTVAWRFSPNATTADRQTALYDADRTSVVRWLSPHTPVLVDHKEDGWAWVQLPNRVWGWVKNKALQAAP